MKMIRCAAVFILMLAWTLASAQSTTLDACLRKVDEESRFSALVGKIGGAAPAQAANDEALATNKDKPLLNNWIAARSACLDSAEGNAVYRPPLTAYAVDAERKLLADTAMLADQKISFGEFKRRRAAIEAEKQGKIAALNHRIRDQSAGFEADQRARELQQMQKDIDEAERQATLAQQQVAQMEARRAQYSQRYRSPPPAPVPVTPYYYRNCVSARGRIACPR